MRDSFPSPRNSGIPAKAGAYKFKWGWLKSCYGLKRRKVIKLIHIGS